MENLAWASVQILGYVKTHEHRNQLVESQNHNPTTSLHVQDNSFLSTSPKILFCDLKLGKDESKTCKLTLIKSIQHFIHQPLILDFYREQIPYSSPPTYKGIDIKYYYKVSIATQKVGSRVQTLQLPVRIIPLTVEERSEQLPGFCDITNEELAPSNPFLEHEKKSISKVEIALQNLQNITARRKPNFYVITNRRGKVGRFCLFKPNYKLGEDVVGTLDFSCRTIRCVQLSVTLQCEEILAGAKKSIDGKEVVGKITNYTKHHEFCMGLLQTQMILPIPLNVTPTFKTNLVELRWRLHFQFVTTITENLMPTTDSSITELWQAPKSIDIETMVWNLPITVYSTNPTQIFHPSCDETLILK